MNGSIIPREAPKRAGARRHLLDHLAREAFPTRLRGLRRGMLTVVEGNERQMFGAVTSECRLRVNLFVHDPRTYSFATFGGSVGGEPRLTFRVGGPPTISPLFAASSQSTRT